ncbi:hypothetical protein AcW1_002064 [Taiwanofungus camphoratus]|nr:hypothetical protein AcV5_010062 [Antrodia cinnamomea]KAI0944324.1 hypothetical protein AcW1_002064 [Antrodia cinnamomea]KAI0945968.1 hypothetical protein AcV7_010070 [Antrodia cinnamomea]
MQTNSQESHKFSKYLVQSSDVLSDMRVNVSEEAVDKVVWYKERFLADEEIIEHLVDNATSTILWTIHRPKRGWYIRLRTPSFPPGMFIPLLPLPQSSPYQTDAALSFACRTNPPSYSLSNSPQQPFSPPKGSLDSDVTLTDSHRDNVVHSYPPTPPPLTPTVIVRPPSPRSVHAKLEEIDLEASSSRIQPRQTSRAPVTHFLLTPHSTAHVPKPTEKVSIFTRVVSAFKNNVPSHSYSFTLSPLPSTPTAASSSSAEHHTNSVSATPVPLLTFHDRTPVWTVRCSSGCLEIDKTQVRSLGVDMSFYVAVALTYLEFLSERESYLAALND